MLVVSPSEKHSFDLVAWPVDKKKRYLWNLRGAKGYEAQTSARRDSIEMNKGKAKLWSVPMVWVTENNTETATIIKNLTENNNQYLMVAA